MTDNIINSVTGAPIDSDQSLLALMQTIHRSYTPSDKSRAAIADAIARHLGIDYPALHPRQPTPDGAPHAGLLFDDREYSRSADGRWDVL